MVTALIGSTELFTNTYCQHDEHAISFRWYWFSRGVDIRRNGQVFNNRGIVQYGKSYSEIAKEYGR